MSSEKTAAASQVAIEDDMDEEFDDLLDKFQAGPSTDAQPAPERTSDGQRPAGEQIPDEFARDLAEGMEALLAGMQAEDGGEFKKHLEALVAGDGALAGASELLDALNQGGPEPAPGPARAVPLTGDFQTAVKETMEKLKQSDDSAKAKSGPSAAGKEDEKLAALFEKMMAGENGAADENQLQTMLQSFMEELMSKEIMYEPLKDMNRLFPDWIKENRGSLAPADLQRHERQATIIQQVIARFEDPRWDADEKAGAAGFAARQKEVIALLTEMQDCGPPPKEILGDMPAGVFGEDGLPNPEQCVIS